MTDKFGNQISDLTPNDYKIKSFEKTNYKPSEDLIKKLEERARINRQNKKNYKKNKHSRRK